jgi:hypothetical protein
MGEIEYYVISKRQDYNPPAKDLGYHESRRSLNGSSCASMPC